MKLLRFGGKTELYDLEADIGESRDLGTARPEALKRMDLAREKWNREMKQPVFPNPRQ